MKQRIALIALADSPFSRHVVPYLRRVLDLGAFTCVLLHVAEPAAGLTAGPPRMVSIAWPEPMYSDEHDIEYALHPIYKMQQEANIRAEAECMLLDVQQQLQAAGFTVTVDVRFGEPAAEIVAAAQQHHASLIAMATHNRVGLQHMVLGSVAEQVLHDSPVPMLLVGPTVLAAHQDNQEQQVSIVNPVTWWRSITDAKD